MDKGYVCGYSLQMQVEGGAPVTEFSATMTWKKVFSPKKEFVETRTTNVERSTGRTRTTVTVTSTKVSGGAQTNEELLVVTQSKINTHGPGRVVGDSTVLWKYLNPNGLVLGTTTKGIEQEDPTESDNSLHIYLIDIVTGQVLTSQVQKYAHPPLNVLAADNYIIYNYWSAKTHTTQVTVMDLYWNTPGWERYSNFRLISDEIRDTFSSFSSLTQIRRGSNNEFQLKTKQPFDVQSQTYTSAVSISSIAVTVTSHGITNPQLLRKSKHA
jgi:hypothetical protein